MKGILSKQFVLLISQFLHFVRQSAIKSPELLGRERLECHSSTLVWPPLLEGAKFAIPGVGFHLVKKRHSRAARREVPFDFGIPFSVVPFNKPSGESRLLFPRQLFNRVLNFRKIHRFYATSRTLVNASGRYTERFT